MSDNKYLTVNDSRGACINLEREDDGVVNVWIAAPGDNDGQSMVLGEDAQALVAAYLTGGAA